MKRFRSSAAILIFVLMLAAAITAHGEGVLEWEDPPAMVRPGKIIRLSFSATHAGNADIVLKDESGKTAVVIAENFPAKAGRNNLSWDGQISGSPVSPGSYTLLVIQGEQKASSVLAVGEISPVILSAVPSDTLLMPGEALHLQVEINMQAALTLSLVVNPGHIVLSEALLPEGSHEIDWDGTANGSPLDPGSYILSLSLQDDSGFSSNSEQFPIVIGDPSPAYVQPNTVLDAESVIPISYTPADEEGTDDSESQASETPDVITIVKSNTEEAHSPADFSSYDCNHESCFFTLPMGVMDEAAIWKAMMQPMTVVKGEQKQVVKIYKEPTRDSQAVGEVTCDSQGLHVIESLENGWSLVEAYSSSIHTSKVKNWAGFFSGYIETSKLETKQPNEKFGLLLDKLTQRMYVFQEGKIITELMVSTGLVNDKQPYNETPAGEFMIVSWTGGFWSGNMWCDLALRVNGGILIHEVPCFKSEDDVRDYGPFERVLGQKASHGCIRIQQEKSPEGINMRWLWDHLKLSTRVFIWDDVGRNIPIPADDTPVYYNPDGGRYYHVDQNCKSTSKKYLPLKEFTYAELDESPYDKLTRCPYCNPPKRALEIEALNEEKR